MFLENLENELRKSALIRTENGAYGYASTGKALLDMNFKVASYRNASDITIWNDFVRAFHEGPLLAMRWLFYVRDAREGVGERRLFRVIARELARWDETSAIMLKTLPLFAVFGRWDDLFELYSIVGYRNVILRMVANQINSDMENMSKGNSISLLAKWMPTENCHNATRIAIAHDMMRAFGLRASVYRKTISMLRKHLDVVERKMSARDWAHIDYSKVPSRANLKYTGAFLAHDEIRRRAYLGAVLKGEKKINSSVNFPHDIVHKYIGDSQRYGWGIKAGISRDDALEALWKALPTYSLESTLVVADGSGSMWSNPLGKSTIQPWEVAHSLAIYFAERAHGEFKNKYITFSSKPQLVNLNGKTLLDNIRIAESHNEVANTNIEAVFTLILNTAVKYRMAQKDIPSSVLIISDMEFDSATGYGHRKETLFAGIERQFKSAGYKLPKLVFWNVASRTGAIPVIENDLGVALVSGFSPAIAKMVMSNEVDPYKALVSELMSERYDVVESALVS